MWPYINHVPQPAIFVEYRPFFGRPVQQQQIYNPFPPLQPAFPNYQYFQTNPQQIIILPQNKPNEKTKVPKHIKEIDKNQVKQFYFSNNKSLRKTREKFGIGYDRIKNIVNDIDTTRHYQITTPEEDHFIMTSAMKGFLTSSEIVKMVFATFGHKISHDTVTRRLHKYGFSFLKPRVVQHLTDDQKKVRYNFCLRMLDTSEQIFPYIIFTDESRFCNSPDNYMCWRKKNDFTESATVQKAKKSLSLMVWGGIGYNFKSQLYFHNGPVRGQEYRECLKETNFFNQADEQFGKGGYIFQQDGATCHTREDIIQFINQQSRMLHGWPPNSPDLSPIEMVWAYMKKKQCSLPQPKNKEELISQIQQLWDEIPQESINKLILSFKYRLEMCRDVGGKTISHFLSAKKHAIPPEYKEDNPPLIEDENYIRIYELSRTYKRKWKKISQMFFDEKNITISPLLIRHKVLEMEHKIKDYELYHDYYEKCPKDIEPIVNEENLEYDFRNHPIDEDDSDVTAHQNHEHRIRINIPRESGEHESFLVPEYLEENDDSDWSLSTDGED